MVGRESGVSGRSPGRVACLTDPSRRSWRSRRRSRRGSVQRRAPEAGTAVVEGKGDGSCTLVDLSSKTDLEEPFTATERTSRRGLIRGPGKAVDEGGGERSCTLVILNRCGGREEPSPGMESGSMGA